MEARTAQSSWRSYGTQRHKSLCRLAPRKAPGARTVHRSAKPLEARTARGLVQYTEAESLERLAPREGAYSTAPAQEPYCTSSPHSHIVQNACERAPHKSPHARSHVLAPVPERAQAHAYTSHPMKLPLTHKGAAHKDVLAPCRGSY